MSNFIFPKIIDDIRGACLANITINPKDAKRFFKVSEGSYGAGDEFLGITVPNLRKIAKIYNDVDLKTVQELLWSRYNEERLLALLILVDQYQKSCNIDNQTKLSAFYLGNLDRINNWNLVDCSAHHILGHYLFDKDRYILNKLAMSEILWERRIAIVATLYFIRKSDLKSTLEIAKLLLRDQHDLIHKAVGWMLREVGKKDNARLISFLSDYANQMHRTTLRYAMEKLSHEQKKIIRS